MMGSGGGGFAAAEVGISRSELKSITQKISEDKTISEQTRRELLQQINVDPTGFSGRKTLGKVQQSFTAAKEGLGKFKGRQLKQAQIDILQDRPGRKQTILTKDSVI